MIFQDTVISYLLQNEVKENHLNHLNNPLFGVVIKSINRRDLIDDQGHALYDFSTQCYLGFDFESSIIKAHQQAFEKEGNVVPWCRFIGTMNVFTQAETALAHLMGTEAANLFLSTTLLNHGVIPAIAGTPKAAIFIDSLAHKTMLEGALIAQGKGGIVHFFQHSDFNELDDLLHTHTHTPIKLILCDGVSSMSGDYTPLPKLNELAQKHGALIYVDDAHGFGVVGENPSPQNPYGLKGNGLVNYFGLPYDNILYVGCLSKAYGLTGAFVACSLQMKKFLLSSATPHDLGGSGPTAAVFGLLQALQLNAETGTERRHRIKENTTRINIALRQLGFDFNQKNTDFPIITVRLPVSCDLNAICHILYKNHILVTVEPDYISADGLFHLLRITVTCDLQPQHITHLIQAFSYIKHAL